VESSTTEVSFTVEEPEEVDGDEPQPDRHNANNKVIIKNLDFISITSQNIMKILYHSAINVSIPLSESEPVKVHSPKGITQMP
jgi:hypothetical protein